MSKMIIRPTSMGLAFLNAAEKAIKSAKVPEVVKEEPKPEPKTQREKAEAETARLRAAMHPKKQAQAHSADKVDHAPWVARRVALNQSHIGLKAEPSWNARLSFRTAEYLKKQGIL